jgi:hypothetical protein
MEVDFPKLTLGFGFGKAVKRNERNNCQLLLIGAPTLGKTLPIF